LHSKLHLILTPIKTANTTNAFTTLECHVFGHPIIENIILKPMKGKEEKKKKEKESRSPL
jgi:hypothetical protein